MSDSPNIVVNVRLQMGPGGMDALRTPLLNMQAASRAENGCLDYTFSVELDDPNSLRITERWENMTSLEAHFATDHMGRFQEAMAANPPHDRMAHFYEVAEVTPPRP